MIKAILFDFGGTLDTDGIHWSEKFWEAYQNLKVPITKKQYEKSYVFSENNVQGLIRTSDSFLNILIRQVLFQVKYLRDNNWISESESRDYMMDIPGICYDETLRTAERSAAVLENLRKNFQLGVVSNFYGNLDTVLRELSLAEYFDVVVDSHIVGIRKPDPAIFSLAVDRMEVEPELTLVVGDSYKRDIVPAKAVGCRTVWIDGKSWTRPDDVADADFIVKSLSEIENIVSKIESGHKQTGK